MNLDGSAWFEIRVVPLLQSKEELRWIKCYKNIKRTVETLPFSLTMCGTILVNCKY